MSADAAREALADAVWNMADDIQGWPVEWPERAAWAQRLREVAGAIRVVATAGAGGALRTAREGVLALATDCCPSCRAGERVERDEHGCWWHPVAEEGQEDKECASELALEALWIVSAALAAPVPADGAGDAVREECVRAVLHECARRCGWGYMPYSTVEEFVAFESERRKLVVEELAAARADALTEAWAKWQEMDEEAFNSWLAAAPRAGATTPGGADA